MTQPGRCPQCNAEIPADAPQGLCPDCLLKAGFSTGGGSQPGPQPAPTTPYPGRFVPPQPAELAPHFPQLEILELLGQGGMGAVYKARQPGLDRLVALKVLPHEVGSDPAFAERFTREARALAKLSHPHIVAVYDFGETESPLSPLGRGAGGEGAGGEGAQGDEPLFYFIMEFVDGVNLRQMLAAGQLQPREALAIVPQICEALQYAHDEGIVHRDIKPENVLVDRKGRVKIADFGLAKLLGRPAADYSLTGTGQVMGTPHYMAPEQIEHPQEVDHRADIYSLGVVFYEMLTGELPLGRFAPPSKRVQVDVRLDEVVMRALEKEPGRRYQHVSEVKTEVEAISGSAPLLARVPAARVPDEVMRRRVTVLTLAVITLAETAFLGLQAGYLAGAEWYFKQELPYGWISSFLAVLAALGGAYLAWWWYLLAKAPETPRSFADFFRVMQTPDRRAKRLWLPLGVFLGVLAVAEAIAIGTLEDAGQAVVGSCPFVVGPYLLMAVLWRAYRPQAAFAAAATRRSSTAAEPGVPAAVARQIGGPARGLLVTAILALVWQVCFAACCVYWVSAIRGHVDNVVFLTVLTMPLSGVMLVGAVNMRRGQFYGLAVTAALLAMLPLSPAWVVGMPVGIWTLLVLRKAEVRAAFGLSNGFHAGRLAKTAGAVALWTGLIAVAIYGTLWLADEYAPASYTVVNTTQLNPVYNERGFGSEGDPFILLGPHAVEIVAAGAGRTRGRHPPPERLPRQRLTLLLRKGPYEQALGETAIDLDTLGYRYRDLEGKLTTSESGLDKKAILDWMKASGLDAKRLTQQWSELGTKDGSVRWFKVPRFELEAANLVEIAEQAAGRKIADLLNPAALLAWRDSWECKVTMDPWVVPGVCAGWVAIWLGGCVVWVRRMRRKP